MFDIRYHIASLVSVFLALAIGILLGTVIQEKGIISDRQQALVQKLEDDYTALRKENKQTKEQLSASQKFSTEVMPYLTENKLTGKNIVLFAVGDLDREMKKNVLSTLVQAGATVQSVTTFFPAGVDINQAFANLHQSQTGSMNPKFPEYRQAIVSTAVKQLTTITPPTIIKKLNQAGLIESTGNYQSKIDGILLYISSKSGVDSKVLAQLMAPLKTMRIPVVGIERSNSESKAAKVCEDNGLSSVDNIDNIPGQIALVELLRGTKGNFGIKEDSRQLLPSLTP